MDNIKKIKKRATNVQQMCNFLIKKLCYYIIVDSWKSTPKIPLQLKETTECKSSVNVGAVVLRLGSIPKAPKFVHLFTPLKKAGFGLSFFIGKLNF